MILEEYMERGLSQWGIVCTEKMLLQLRQYYSMLEDTNKVMNLTAIEGEEDTAQLHFMDCASILLEGELGDQSVADIGTGAGFPGVVLKILSPEIRLTLIDSLDKRIRFLGEVCERLELKDTVCLHARAEELPKEMRGHFDLVTSRAVARLSVLSELCLPYTRQGGRFISMKGPDCQEETEEASNAIRKLGGKPARIRAYHIPETDIQHSLVIIGKDGITSSQYPRRWAQIKKNPL